MRLVRLSVIALFLVTLPLQAGIIKKAEIDLPDGFAESSDAYSVTRAFWTHSKAPMKFGTFEITEHRRGWEKSHSSATPVTPPWFPIREARHVKAERSSSENSYAFTLLDGGSPQWKAACVTRSQSEELSVVGIPVRGEGSADLICRFADVSDEAAVWTLTVQTHASLKNFSAKTTGELTDGTVSLSIEPITKFEGSDFVVPGAIGLTIESEAGVLGAADTAGKGVVYLAREGDPKTRALVAASFAAILLND